MAKIEHSFIDFKTLDTLSYQQTFIHKLDPRAKLLTTLTYILFVLSFSKYDITGLVPFVMYPVALIALGNLPLGYLLKKILMAVPFALCVGIFNPILDRNVMIYLGPLGISGGWISFTSIMIRFVLTVSAVLALIACTGLNSVCMAMEKLGAPRSFAVQLLFLYRYIFVMTDEASRLVRARSLRSFGANGTGFRVYASMIGQLLLRAMDRAQRIYRAMLCRGFDGEIRSTRPLNAGGGDLLFFIGWLIFFILMRVYNLPQWMGNLTGAWLK